MWQASARRNGALIVFSNETGKGIDVRDQEEEL
jgi:hypothetical protein